MFETRLLHPTPTEPSQADYPPAHRGWLSWLPWWLPTWVPALTLALVLALAAAMVLLVALHGPSR